MANKTKWAIGIAVAVIMAAIAITAVMLPGAPLKGAVANAPTISQGAPADTESAPSIAVASDVSAEALIENFELDKATAEQLAALPEQDRASAIASTLAADGVFEVALEGDELTVIRPFAAKRLIVVSEPGETFSGEAGRSVEDDGTTLISFATQHDAAAAFEQLHQSGVEVVADASVEALGVPGEYSGWGISEMKLDEAADALETADVSAVTVAIIDSGADANHAAFTGRTFSEASASFIDESTADLNGHGTQVSSIIAAGTPSSVALMEVKALNAKGNGSLYDICRAVRYAADNGADVINLSVGADLGRGVAGSSSRKMFDAALSYASAKGSIIVCAASNEGNDIASAGTYPAASEYVYSVAAIGADGKVASWSNYGAALDFAAPGVDVETASADGVAIANGTSFASPHVAAFAADLRSLYPTKATDELMNDVKAMSKDLGEPGFDVRYGYGEPVFDLSVLSNNDVEAPTPTLVNITEVPASENLVVTNPVYRTSGPTVLDEITLSISSIGTPNIWATEADLGQPGTIALHNLVDGWPVPDGFNTSDVTVAVGDDIPNLYESLAGIDHETWEFGGYSLVGSRNGYIQTQEFYDTTMYAKYMNLYYMWKQNPPESTIATEDQTGENGTVTYKIFGYPGAPTNYNGLNLSTVNEVTETQIIGTTFDFHGLDEYIEDENGMIWNLDIRVTFPDGGIKSKGVSMNDVPFEFSEAIFYIYVTPDANWRASQDYADIGESGNVLYIDISTLYNLPRPNDAGQAITTRTRTIGQDYTLDAGKVSNESGWKFIGWDLDVNAYMDFWHNNEAVTSKAANYLYGNVIPGDFDAKTVAVYGYWEYYDSSLTIHKTDRAGNPLEDAVFDIYAYGESSSRSVDDEMTGTAIPALDKLSSVIALEYGRACGRTDANGDLVIYYNRGAGATSIVTKTTAANDSVSGFRIREVFYPRGYIYEKINDVLVNDYHLMLNADGTGTLYKVNGNVLLEETSVNGDEITIVNEDFGVPIIKTDALGDPIEGVTFKVELIPDENWESPYDDFAEKSLSTKEAATPWPDPAEWSYTYTTTTDAQGHAFLRLDSWIYFMFKDFPHSGISTKSIDDSNANSETWSLPTVTYKVTEIAGPNGVILDNGCWYIDAVLSFTEYYDDSAPANILSIKSEPVSEDSLAMNYSVAYTMYDGQGNETPVHGVLAWAGDDADYQIIDDMYAPITYKWSGEYPADAQLPVPDNTHLVGSDVRNSLAPAPTTTDVHYAFAGWQVPAAASALPRAGIEVVGSWHKAAELVLEAFGENGRALTGSKFRVMMAGGTTVDLTVDAGGNLDSSAIVAYFLAGGTSATISETNTATGYDAAHGAWTIKPVLNGSSISSYQISYNTGTGDDAGFDYSQQEGLFTLMLRNKQSMVRVTMESPEGDYPALPDPFDVEYGASPSLSTPTGNEMWTFAGWYSDADLTQPYESHALTENTVLYAKWDPVTQVEYAEITFVYPEGMEGAPDPIQVEVGTVPELPEPEDTDENTFAGWYLDPNLAKAYDGSTVEGDMTLYAKWDPVEQVEYAEITFVYPEGMEGAPDPIKVEVGTVPELPTPEDTDENKFVDWYRNAELTEAYDGSTVEGDMTLYAKWEPIPQTEYAEITFVYPEGMAGAPDPIKVEVGTVPELPAVDAIAGFEFAGWFADAELTKAYEGGAVESDMTLYAKWNPVPQDSGQASDLVTPTPTPTPAPLISTGDTTLYVIIGVVAAAVIAAVIVALVRRSRK